ncbi:ATPase [Candidatus Scalindua japonica]|uniref:ATPase n=1 Tax=Candidatus Scalindua japonica TaxID=1284222 RepID=A0A286TZH3_9BACT|nr:CpsD/CapB family tyrosine-protein kinase [Candidatus Scalindua japonica]GAX61258.1 ATPase [Candidatus Scalindua japonica]
MSKIYKALEHARQEQKGLKEIPFADNIAERSPAKVHKKIDMEDEMILLYQNINSLLSEFPNKIIQFISSSRGEGTSSVIREFARISTSKLDKNVLLLDAKSNSCHSKFFGIKPRGGVAEVISNGRSINDVLHQIGNSKLYVGQLSLNGDYVTSIFGSPKISDIFEELKQKFDYILIDSPSADTSSDIIAISNKVHGVVMVVEADHTKWQKINIVKEKIKNNGGNILGVILNKRKHYIPECIYKRL